MSATILPGARVVDVGVTAGSLRFSLPGPAGGDRVVSEPSGRVLGEGASAAREAVRAWPGYAPTPLHRLDGLAERLGVKSVWAKDETGRFGLGAFKALGGPYAVLRALQDRVEQKVGRRPEPEELRGGCAEVAKVVERVTVTTASAGNHGRSVAWGCSELGCRCVVYLPEGTDRARVRAIESHGARVVEMAGAYDEVMGLALEEAERRNWLLVSDTAYEGYEETPRHVMGGYTLLAEEMIEAIEARGAGPLTHLFVQAGVGGLATGVCWHFLQRLGSERPRFVAVEPWRADCFGRSLRAGRQVTVPPPFDTAMGGLAAGVPSTTAWCFLSGNLDAALALPESVWRAGAAALATGELGPPMIDAGPSGAAGAGALLALARLPALGRQLGLGPKSSVGVIVTEKRFS